MGKIYTDSVLVGGTEKWLKWHCVVPIAIRSVVVSPVDRRSSSVVTRSTIQYHYSAKEKDC